MLRLFFSFVSFVVFLFCARAGESTSSVIGQEVKNVKVIDANKNAKDIPFLGEKIITVFYTDPDARDVNEPLTQELLKRKFPGEKYRGVGIANCSDTWLPDATIRYGARQKEAQYPGSIILLDENKIVSKAWGLGDCNEAGVVIVIGKDRKVKFFKAVKSQEESRSITSSVVKIIESELNK